MSIAEARLLMSGSGNGPIVAFNAVSLEHAEAIVDAAERARRPVILAISSNTVRFHGRLGPFADACSRLAAECGQSIALHFDHVEQLSLVRVAADAGFSSVMFDASRLDFTANCEQTALASEFAHADGLWVESELGEIGGKDGAHSATARTDLREAQIFVERTGIDALAVAVGTSHAMTGRDAIVDYELIGHLRDNLAVPLVLHGSSGLDDERIAQAARAGITKINVGTRLNVAWMGAVRDRVLHDTSVDPRPALREAREAMTVAMTALLHVFEIPPKKGPEQ